MSEQPVHNRFKLIEAKIRDPKVKVVSFDVFDTLVHRKVLEPWHVFLLIEKRLGRAPYKQRFPGLARDFAKTRQSAESTLRKECDATLGRHQEILIEEVYGRIAALHGLTQQDVKTLVALEQRVELTQLVARQPLVDLFRLSLELGKDTLIISDFIHPQRFVEKVLRHAGVDGWTHCYVSSDIGIKKIDGDIYERIIQDHGYDVATWYHIGDNQRGDIASAQDRGIATGYVQSKPSISKDLAKKQGLNMWVVSNSLMLSTILASHSARRVELDQDPRALGEGAGLFGQLEDIGFLALGPMMHFFAKHIYEEAKKMKAEQVVFLARDCWLPYNMFEGIQKKYGSANINAVYLPASRRSCQGLNVTAASDVLEVQISGFSRDKTVRDLFRTRFEFSEEDLEAFEGLAPEGALDQLLSEVDAFKVAEWAKSCAEVNLDRVVARSKEKRKNFIYFAESTGVDFSARTMIVDLGYRGTIFDMIQGLFSTSPKLQMFLSFSDMLGERDRGHNKAFYIDNALGSYRVSDPIISNRLLVEALINQGCPSVLGYATDGTSAPSCVYGASLSQGHLSAVEKIHNGALAFSETWLSDYSEADETCSAHTTSLSFFFRNLAEKPDAYQADLLAPIEFENETDGFENMSICGVPENDFQDAIWFPGANALRARRVAEAKRVAEEKAAAERAEAKRVAEAMAAAKKAEEERAAAERAEAERIAREAAEEAARRAAAPLVVKAGRWAVEKMRGGASSPKG